LAFREVLRKGPAKDARGSVQLARKRVTGATVLARAWRWERLGKSSRV
jgi:hypothetical protein